MPELLPDYYELEAHGIEVVAERPNQRVVQTTPPPPHRPIKFVCFWDSVVARWRVARRA